MIKTYCFQSNYSFLFLSVLIFIATVKLKTARVIFIELSSSSCAVDHFFLRAFSWAIKNLQTLLLFCLISLFCTSDSSLNTFKMIFLKNKKIEISNYKNKLNEKGQRRHIRVPTTRFILNSMRKYRRFAETAE